MYTESLFPGDISDSQHMIKSEIFEEQNEFVKNDTTDNDIDPFCNEVDKGYIILKVAYHTGEHLTL